ncbi:DUF2809 domain-containing protein [Bradyrhizobium sp. SYSU BS000235]|uniref:ribosomal maturation YjgA family protein n=1 Tax=Bradyrhizobium sp. SYSU BS000235 TaxID=3411332 RepID=UPI003C70BE07
MRFAGRSKYFVLALAIIGIGLLTRLSPPGHHALFKYLGSALWGGMVYCLLASLAPKTSPSRIAIVAAVIAAGVEFSQLWHTDALDAFRATRIGVLLIGRFFSWWDIVAYSAGIIAIAALDACALRQRIGRAN